METPPLVVGWREWLGLPVLNTPWIKAKVDTGATSSALHAFELEYFDKGSLPWVRFVVYPWQNSEADAAEVEAELVEIRSVRSSSGVAEERPVINTVAKVGDLEIDIEITLTRRDQMGFRMLLGREATKGRYLVDPGRSYLTGRPPKAVRAANKAVHL